MYPASEFRHKRTKSEYIQTGKKQGPGAYPVPLKNNYTKQGNKERPPSESINALGALGILGPVAGGMTGNRSSFKLVYGGGGGEGELPDIGQRGAEEEERFNLNLNFNAANGPAGNTTITNNTNIILIGGRTYKISTSTHSPPEVVQINAKVGSEVTQYLVRSGSKTAIQKGLRTTHSHINATPQKNHMNLYRAYPDDDSGIVPGPIAATSLGSHQRSKSEVHGTKTRGTLQPRLFAAKAPVPRETGIQPLALKGQNQRQATIARLQAEVNEKVYRKTLTSKCPKPRQTPGKALEKFDFRKTSTASNCGGSSVSSGGSSLVPKSSPNPNPNPNSNPSHNPNPNPKTKNLTKECSIEMLSPPVHLQEGYRTNPSCPQDRTTNSQPSDLYGNKPKYSFTLRTDDNSTAHDSATSTLDFSYLEAKLPRVSKVPTLSAVTKVSKMSHSPKVADAFDVPESKKALGKRQRNILELTDYIKQCMAYSTNCRLARNPSHARDLRSLLQDREDIGEGGVWTGESGSAQAIGEVRGDQVDKQGADEGRGFAGQGDEGGGHLGAADPPQRDSVGVCPTALGFTRPSSRKSIYSSSRSCVRAGTC